MMKESEIKVGVRVRGLAFGRTNEIGTITKIINQDICRIKWDSGGNLSTSWSIRQITDYSEVYIPDDCS